MERRNFFKRLGCLIIGFAITPVVIEATKNEISEYEKALRTETDRQAKYLHEILVTNPNFCEMGGHVVLRGGWSCNNKYVPMYVTDLPGIINGKAESKEMFELRKSIFRPMTDKLVKQLING